MGDNVDLVTLYPYQTMTLKDSKGIKGSAFYIFNYGHVYTR